MTGVYVGGLIFQYSEDLGSDSEEPGYGYGLFDLDSCESGFTSMCLDNKKLFWPPPAWLSRYPTVEWAQRMDRVFITVLLADATSAMVKLDPHAGFTFSASAGAEKHLYELKLELFDKVNVEESKINVSAGSVFTILEKAEKKWWTKLLRGDGKEPHYVNYDLEKWVPVPHYVTVETGPESPDALDLGGMDFSEFRVIADMGGMVGLGGMVDGLYVGDLGGMVDDLNDGDKDEEVGRRGSKGRSA